MAIDVEPEQPVVGWAPPATAKRPEWMSQHVGTASEILDRLQSALYFIGSRWADRTELFLRAATALFWKFR